MPDTRPTDRAITIGEPTAATIAARVEQYRELWGWHDATDDTMAGWGAHREQARHRLPKDRQTVHMLASIDLMLEDLDALLAARAPAPPDAAQALRDAVREAGRNIGHYKAAQSALTRDLGLDSTQAGDVGRILSGLRRNVSEDYRSAVDYVLNAAEPDAAEPDAATRTVPSPAAYLREFHTTYAVPMRDRPTWDVPELGLRESLMEEEHEEYQEASRVGDLVELADGLGDIVYVAYGTALSHGFDLDEVLAEIHRSNMSKLGADGRPIYRPGDGKVMKGPGYFKPDIAGVLGLSAAADPGTRGEGDDRG